MTKRALQFIENSLRQNQPTVMLRLYITDNLVSITADFFTDKNVTKITILFLEQKFLSDGVWWCFHQ